MGFLLSKSATWISALRMNSKVDDHLMQGTAKSELDPVTPLFQNTKKIILEDLNQGDFVQGNFTKIERTYSGSLSREASDSVVYVKENDGLEVTDLE